MDEATKHDSNCIVQIVAEGLEKLATICQRRNQPMPSKLVLISDNTVREVKNSHCMAYLQNLCGLRKMRLCAMLFLRKSHTHCRLDQCFGILARRVANTDQILDATDTCNLLQKELERPGFRAWVGSTTEVSVSKLDATLNWRDHFRCQGASVSGGLLVDATANHVFVMMQQKGPRGFKVILYFDTIVHM